MMSAGNRPSHIKIVRKAWQSEGSAARDGAADAQCWPGWPEEGRLAGRGAWGRRIWPRFSAMLVLRVKPAGAYGYETCRLGEGFLRTLHLLIFFPLEETPRLHESLFVTELLLDI